MGKRVRGDAEVKRWPAMTGSGKNVVDIERVRPGLPEESQSVEKYYLSRI
jgi:hypothetical protein